jgi:DNA modification methylase
MAWCSDYGAARIKYHFWDGLCRQTERNDRYHPTQKPLDVIRWCLSFYPKAKTILDPFMGSGTTLRAAKDLGLSAIGIEIEERYCEIAANRLRQGVLKFEPPRNGYKQQSLLAEIAQDVVLNR